MRPSPARGRMQALKCLAGNSPMNRCCVRNLVRGAYAPMNEFRGSGLEAAGGGGFGAKTSGGGDSCVKTSGGGFGVKASGGGGGPAGSVPEFEDLGGELVCVGVEPVVELFYRRVFLPCDVI